MRKKDLILPTPTEGEHVSNFSYYQMIDGTQVPILHLYYPQSGDHFWQGRRWSQKEWYAWINSLEPAEAN